MSMTTGLALVLRQSCGLVVVCVLSLICASPARAAEPPTPGISQAIEVELLAAHWSAVFEQCGADADIDGQPVLRALKGHAAQVLNRNNEAVLLLMSVSRDPDRARWAEWAGAFVAAHPEIAVAHFLAGDAQARLGRMDEAITAFGRSLQVDPKFALALHARGVVYAFEEKWDPARADLERAIALAPSFAEAYVSFGNLLLLRRAAPGARSAFDQALKLSPDYAIALNGRGCAEYAEADWEKANQDFAASGRSMPLPVSLYNLRALAVAAEATQLSGYENSPLFRVTDFLDWQTLQTSSQREGDLLRTARGGMGLPEQIAPEVVRELNQALDRPSYYAQVKGQVSLADASEKLRGLVTMTAALADHPWTSLAEDQKDAVRVRNRLLIEFAYPYAIARYENRDPGTQLTLTRGLVNQLDYKRSLSPDRIVMGQARMDYVYKPLANLMEKSGLPPLAWVGKQLNDHYAQSTLTNQMAFKERWGMDLKREMPGGVLADLRRAHVDSGDWKVNNWFGLAYASD